MEFNFTKAQEYELAWQKKYILDNFVKQKEDWEMHKLSEQYNHFHRHFFKKDNIEFLNHIKGKTALEIGCGSFPLLKEAHDVGRKILIDPLADQYRKIQNDNFGFSFFEDAEIHFTQAEMFIPGILVDGVIVCRNALDHSEDPFMILDTITEYALNGCYLLLWSDIWHYDGGNEGHRNITKSTRVMDALLSGLGWDKYDSVPKVREHEIFIEYGGIFIKL